MLAKVELFKVGNRIFVSRTGVRFSLPAVSHQFVGDDIERREAADEARANRRDLLPTEKMLSHVSHSLTTFLFKLTLEAPINALAGMFYFVNSLSLKNSNS
jgi:hypothetical protein